MDKENNGTSNKENLNANQDPKSVAEASISTEKRDNANSPSKYSTKTKKLILYLALIFSIFISSVSGVMAKYASFQEWMSFKFFLFYALEIFMLGVYAIIWQQVIKHINLSIAYVFKATTLIWTLIWGIFIFNETFTVTKIIGVAIVIGGIMIANWKK